MPHIDEGTLHAYLDGALDLYPADEAERVRSHLEACGECRERLEEERTIRAEAEAILASAAPDVSAPPFEELRAEAARRGSLEQRRGLSRVNRWAWAASVVLALGTGWMLRGSIGGWISQPGPQEQAAEPSVAEPSLAEPSVAEPSVAGPASADVVPDPANEPEATEGAAEEASVEDVTMPPPPPAGAGGQVTEALPTVTEAEPTATGAEEAEGASKQVSTDATVGVTAAPAAAERDALVLEARRADRPGFRVQQAPEARFRLLPLPVAGREAAEGDRFAVPGLLVVEAERLSSEGTFPQGTTRVLQLTESGETLEIFHFLPGVEPPAVTGLTGTDVNETVILIEAGGVASWTLLRGALSEAELLAFGERLRAGG